jgi:hypothetical protein
MSYKRVLDLISKLLKQKVVFLFCKEEYFRIFLIAKNNIIQ